MVTQVVCDVCAVSEGDVRALAARLRPRPEVVTLGATTLDGIFDDIRSVASALGVTDRADALVERARGRMRVVHETLKSARAPRPRVAVIEWTDPCSRRDTGCRRWSTARVVRMSLAEPGEHSRTRTLDVIRDADPEFILIAPCGFDVERAAVDGERALATDAWSWARARQVWAVDANAYLSRPGPRVVDGIELLAKILHSSLFGGPDSIAARRIA
jgi:iron complex transport system substrate-binding protein